MSNVLEKSLSCKKTVTRGVTLLELLIVCAVIAILGALGSGYIISAIAQANEVKCVNNTRILLTGIQQLTDNTPITGIPGVKGRQYPLVENTSGTSWIEMLKPYGVENPAAYHCPEALSDSQPSYGLNPLCGAEWMYQYMTFGGFLLMPEEKRPRNTALIKSPGKTILLSESGKISSESAEQTPENWVETEADWKPYVAFAVKDTTSGTYGQSFDYGYNWANTVSSSRKGSMEWDQYNRPAGRHGSTHKVTNGFIDGHCKALNITELVTPQFKDANCLFNNQ